MILRLQGATPSTYRSSEVRKARPVLVLARRPAKTCISLPVAATRIPVAAEPTFGGKKWTLPGDFVALADHLRDRRESLCSNGTGRSARPWSKSRRFTAANGAARSHSGVSEGLRRSPSPYAGAAVEAAAEEPAAAHGLQRWQQGYDLREVIRELGQFNRCVIIRIGPLSQRA